MAKSKTIYICSECGNETLNWSGKCPACGAWNSIKEVPRTKNDSAIRDFNISQIKKLNSLSVNSEVKFHTGITEFDRVMGGGAVTGALYLVGGAPGIGKSTLLMQMCKNISEEILYVSGEESERQLKLRAERLNVNSPNINVLTENDIDAVISATDEIKPKVLIIDSIQTVYDPSVGSAAGSVSQIRECTMKIMRTAKRENITVFIVGHITKDGNIAGPKILEHMVDCVLYFEGERDTSFRILRAEKNRFGSTNEIGVFEMNSFGLKCVENPSELLLSGRPDNASGTCVACIIEGSRPILAEVQALVCQSNYNPSRRSNGIDYNRAAMLIAVLEKRGSVPVGNCDIYINVVGGLRLDETAADLPTVLALSSSYYDRVIDRNLIAFGEVGLSGEIRSVSNILQRVQEAKRIGFSDFIVPYQSFEEIKSINGITVYPVKTLSDALRAAFRKKTE